MLLLQEDSQNVRNELAGMHSLSEKNKKCHCTRALNGEGPIIYLLTT